MTRWADNLKITDRIPKQQVLEPNGSCEVDSESEREYRKAGFLQKRLGTSLVLRKTTRSDDNTHLVTDIA